MLKDATTCSKYCNTLAAKLSQCPPLDPNNNETNLDEEWLNTKVVLQSTAEETLGFSTRRHQDWFDENAEGIHDLLVVKKKKQLAGSS